MPLYILSDVIDVGMDEEYIAYFAAHPFPRLMDPIESIMEEDEDRGGGRWRRWRRGVARRMVRGRGGPRDGGEMATGVELAWARQGDRPLRPPIGRGGQLL